MTTKAEVLYPVFCLIGLPQAGKTTVARLIAERTGLKRGTCSDIIYDIYRRVEGLPEGNWHEVIPKEDQNAVRNKLILLGNAIGDEVPFVYPVALLKRGCRVIDGVRRKGELKALEEHFNNNHIPMLKVWVTRPDMPAIYDNTELTPSDGNIMLNTDSLEDLREAVDDMLAKYHKDTIPSPYLIPAYHDDPAGCEIKLLKADNRCPICGKQGVWRRGVHFDHQMRCVNAECPGKGGDYCSVVWEPEEDYKLVLPTKT